MNKADYINKQIRDWQAMDFVIGYEIHLSNNHDHDCEMCRMLAGKYPKRFIWHGWHDKCTCFVTSILQDPDEFDSQELDEMKKTLEGHIPLKIEPNELIEVLPINFLTWYAKNINKMIEQDMFPDFVRNNIDLIKCSFDYYRKRI